MLDPRDRATAQANRLRKPAFAHPTVDRRPAQAGPMKDFSQPKEPIDLGLLRAPMIWVREKRHRQLLDLIRHVRLPLDGMQQGRGGLACGDKHRPLDRADRFRDGT